MLSQKIKTIRRASPVLLLISVILLQYAQIPGAKADTAVTTTAGATSNTVGWTNPNNANGTADDNIYATAGLTKNTTITSDWTTYGFNSSLPADMTVTKVELIAQFQVNNNGSVTTIGTQAIVSGTACPTTAITDGSQPAVDTNFVNDITSCKTWSRNDLLDANFKTRVTATRANAGGAGTVTYSLDFITARITYNTPTYNQAAYRWYDPADSTTPSTALAAQDTAVTLYAPSDRIRLRYLLDVTIVNLTAGSEQFKLQFGQKSGTCATATYGDVTAATAIAYYNNSTPADNTTISTTANDPTYLGHTVVAQKYSEANPVSTNAITSGQAGVWDASLIINGALANTTYCFRVVKNSGTALSTYTVYPELTTSPSATLDSDFVNASGNSVASPSVALSSATVDLACQTTTGTLGTSSQRMRVRNTTGAPAWSLSIAATSGSTALWSAGTPKYDFNDISGSPAGCSAGLDSDAYAGQLSIDPSGGTLSARTICATTGVTKGSSASFVEGVTNSVTLMSASASAQTGCYWELIGASLSQKIPGGQAAGSYSINLTMTVVAL